MRTALLIIWFASLSFAHGRAQTLQTQYGPVTGTQEGTVYIFRGIPFAAPPTGDLRWRPTQAPQPWTAPRATMEFPPVCPQKHYEQGDTSYTLVGDEDCLYLNVWSPNLTGNYPVMVYIHGGGNQQGSSSETVGGITLYDGKNLADRGNVVVVTIQYRLGILGYLVHPGLEAENSDNTAGNYAVMDQIFALQWVKNNISHFGGDPSNVTIFGESAGGVNVGNLLTCSAATGLFHKAIIESAVPLLNAYATAESEGIDLVNGFISQGSNQDKMKYMRTIPAEELSRTLSNPVQGGIVQQAWQPVVDHHLFSSFPNTAFQSGAFNQVPLIIGSNADEMRPGVPAVVTPTQVRALINSAVPAAYRNTALALYPPGNTNAEAKDSYTGILTDGQFTSTTRRTAQCVSLNQQAPVWRYFFTHTNDFPAIKDWGAFHGLELFYVFNNLEQSLFALGPWYTSQDKEIAQAMLSYWTQFAYTGNPNSSNLPVWPAYNAGTDCYLNIGAIASEDACGLRPAKCDLWDQVTGFNGCVSSLSGIDIHAEPATGPAVYPNPTSGIIHIQSGDPHLKIQVFDLLGHIWGTYQETSVLDLSGLNPGTYLLVWNNGHELFYRKISVVR